MREGGGFQLYRFDVGGLRRAVLDSDVLEPVGEGFAGGGDVGTGLADLFVGAARSLGGQD